MADDRADVGLEDAERMGKALRSVGDEAREALGRFAERIELERRIREQPLTVLAVAASAGFVLGGGLWPALRPIVKGAVRAAMSPANLLAIGAALGAMRAAEDHQDAGEPDTGSEGPMPH
jgi:hypothetical protein